jgi:hypothetical protein
MDDSDQVKFSIPLPLTTCVEMLRVIASLESPDETPGHDSATSGIHRRDTARLWNCKIEDLDMTTYALEVTNAAKNDQARASLSLILVAADSCIDQGKESEKLSASDEKSMCLGLLYACVVDVTKAEATATLKKLVQHVDPGILAGSLSQFISEPSSLATAVGVDFLGFLLSETSAGETKSSALRGALARSLCEACCSSSWDQQVGPQTALLKLTTQLGSEWSRKYETKLINATLLPIKTVPREVTEAAIGALRTFIVVCNTLYGKSSSQVGGTVVWDVLSPDESVAVQGEGISAKTMDNKSVERVYPSEEVFKITIYELTSPQQLTRYAINCRRSRCHCHFQTLTWRHCRRFAARYLLNFFRTDESCDPGSSNDFASKHVDFIRRVLFSRSLRLLPLPHQVGVVEGLAAVVKQYPSLLPLTDPHLLACLSDLLKMASVADREMTDDKLNNVVVDKDGYVPSTVDGDASQYPTHASALFYRRSCLVDIDGTKIVVPGEQPAGVQLRVSTIVLLHGIIRNYTDPFFDAETTTPIGESSVPVRGTHPMQEIHSHLFNFPRREYPPSRSQLAFPIARFESLEGGECIA